MIQEIRKAPTGSSNPCVVSDLERMIRRSLPLAPPRHRECYAPSVDFELANALGRIVELKDRSTAAHTWRVTMYAQAMAEAARVGRKGTQALDLHLKAASGPS